MPLEGHRAGLKVGFHVQSLNGEEIRGAPQIATQTHSVPKGGRNWEESLPLGRKDGSSAPAVQKRGKGGGGPIKEGLRILDGPHGECKKEYKRKE